MTDNGLAAEAELFCGSLQLGLYGIRAELSHSLWRAIAFMSHIFDLCAGVVSQRPRFCFSAYAGFADNIARDAISWEAKLILKGEKSS